MIVLKSSNFVDKSFNLDCFSVSFCSLDLYCIRNMKLILKSAPRFSCGGQKISNLPTTVIDVTFDVGIHQSELEAMIFEMVGFFPLKTVIMMLNLYYQFGFNVKF